MVLVELGLFLAGRVERNIFCSELVIIKVVDRIGLTTWNCKMTQVIKPANRMFKKKLLPMKSAILPP